MILRWHSDGNHGKPKCATTLDEGWGWCCRIPTITRLAASGLCIETKLVAGEIHCAEEAPGQNKEAIITARESCFIYDFTKTYWPAGGGRGQNPENMAQGHSGHNSICPKGGYMSQGRLTWRTRRGERSDPSALGPYFPDFVLVRLQQANMS